MHGISSLFSSSPPSLWDSSADPMKGEVGKIHHWWSTALPNGDLAQVYKTAQELSGQTASSYVYNCRNQWTIVLTSPKHIKSAQKVRWNSLSVQPRDHTVHCMVSQCMVFRPSSLFSSCTLGWTERLLCLASRADSMCLMVKYVTIYNQIMIVRNSKLDTSGAAELVQHTRRIMGHISCLH